MTLTIVRWLLVILVLACGWGYLRSVGFLSAALLANRGFLWVGVVAYVVFPVLVTVGLAVLAYFIPGWVAA